MCSVAVKVINLEFGIYSQNHTLFLRRVTKRKQRNVLIGFANEHKNKRVLIILNIRKNMPRLYSKPTI
jgi:hypothetical protein